MKRHGAACATGHRTVHGNADCWKDAPGSRKRFGPRCTAARTAWRPTARKSAPCTITWENRPVTSASSSASAASSRQRPKRFSRLNSATAKPSPTTCTPCSESAASNRIMPSSTPAAGGCRPISHRPTRPTMPSCAYPSHGIRYGSNVRTPRCRSATYTGKSPGTTQSSSATARANWSRCRSMPTR